MVTYDVPGYFVHSFVSSGNISFTQDTYVDVLVGEDHRGVAVVIPGGLGVVHLQVLGGLFLINFKVEIRLALDLAVDVLRETLLLLALQLLLEAEGVQLLPDEAGDAVLDLLDVLVVPLAGLRDLGEYPLLLLRAAQLGEPFGFGGLLVSLFSEVRLREHLQFLPILLILESAQVRGLRRMRGLRRTHEGLNGGAREPS